MAARKKQSLAERAQNAKAKATRPASLTAVPSPAPVTVQLAGQTDIAAELGMEAPPVVYVPTETPAPAAPTGAGGGFDTSHLTPLVEPAGERTRRAPAPVGDKLVRTSIKVDRPTTDKLLRLQYAEGERTGVMPTRQAYYLAAVTTHLPSLEELKGIDYTLGQHSDAVSVTLRAPATLSRDMAFRKAVYTRLGEQVTARWLGNEAVSRFIASRAAELGIDPDAL